MPRNPSSPSSRTNSRRKCWCSKSSSIDRQDALLRESAGARRCHSRSSSVRSASRSNTASMRGAVAVIVRVLPGRVGRVEPVGAVVLARARAAGCGTRPRLAARRIGLATERCGASGSPTVATGSSPSDSANANASATSFTRPAGTPRREHRSTQWAADAVASAASSSACSSIAVGDPCAALVANRASSARPGIAEHARERAELPVVADGDHELAVGGAEHAYGAMLGCALPSRRGAVARRRASSRAWFASAESRLCSRFTSTSWPTPGAVALAQREQDRRRPRSAR